LTLRQELVEQLLLEEHPRRAVGVVARGETVYRARAVVLTTGTFLQAVMHTGEAKTRGGRAGDTSAEEMSLSQLDCHITYTTEAAHELIRANLHRAPMYSGQIRSQGPRYCPSIEDKVVRFADKDRHQIFLEPEGRNSDRVYVNGVSTSLPQEIQSAMLRLIPGLENAEVMRWGYAVEYDYAPPTQLQATLE